MEAVFSGAAEEYETVYNSGFVTVLDRQENRDGTDQLRGIELSRFIYSTVRLEA
ncbi:MAG: hypothetical protein OXJ56_14740 [Rhodospirillaceae bacterium]|nr:hypothetical protein [Rhodospirillaceae bacterium]